MHDFTIIKTVPRADKLTQQALHPCCWLLVETSAVSDSAAEELVATFL